MSVSSIKNCKSHTLLCLITIYGIHGILVSSSSFPFLVSSEVKPATLKKVIIKNRTSSDISSFNQSSQVVFAVKTSSKVHHSVTCRTHTMEKIANLQIRDEANSSSSQIAIDEKIPSKKKKGFCKNFIASADVSLSSQWIQDLINSTSSSASSTLSVIAFLFSDVSIFKIFSPSSWGIFVGCLIFVFTSTDCER